MFNNFNEQLTTPAPRTTRRHSMTWRRAHGGAGSFRFRQITTLGVAIGALVAITATGAQADVTGHGARHGTTGRVTLAARRAELASLHALATARFDTPASQFDRRRPLHGHPWSPSSGSSTPTAQPPSTTQTTQPTTTVSGDYPVGTADASEPSGMSPPAADALAGYTQSYVNDFAGSSVPSGWEVFTGNPGGDPGAQWGASHVTVGGGLLSLNTFKDPAYNNEWVAGGLCQCGVAHTYGAYFVRSRVTGAGPTQVELLWPTGSWPPEIDFNETDGSTGHTTATIHFGASNSQDQKGVTIDMTQWHTWGVIWTPTSVIYTVDGREWGSVNIASQIPDVPMTLDLTQQTWCASSWACPTTPESLQVDWVAEYTAS